jgi:hypothetical protein
MNWLKNRVEKKEITQEELNQLPKHLKLKKLVSF